ncbi:alanine racemase [Microbacterium sp. SORGH_AS428]|uniref:alanine racemase n=1 Tax=Microbacterium sp. SORGH_AS_0428 TaxID=3041788 RepID=UPI0028672E3F|nr:alanine racemase [Microbacterium sp. SORGH_AS_0428]MDR6198545.1 alanine racemase [Microbacterium sp. SORGH_AS_0428]
MPYASRPRADAVISTPELSVDEDAIRANARYFTRLTRGRLMAVLKADAFGHGPVASAVVEEGATSLGVASIDEALALRRSGVDVPVLSWLNPIGADFLSAVSERVDLGVASADALHATVRAAHRLGRRARLHLHADLGMTRDGAPASEWRSLCELARTAERQGHVQIVGIMGHMSCADRPDHPQNLRERLRFDAAVRSARHRGLAPAVTHLAATAATITGVGGDHDLHRIGAGLYGIDPSRTSRELRFALALRAPVISARRVGADVGVGYGARFTTDRPTHLALLPLGYADGLPRAASHRAEVFVRGRRRPIVGLISMDMAVIDTGDDVLNPGETVTIFGPGDQGEPTVADWARWSDTIEHEIVTRIGARVSRVTRRTHIERTPE